MNTLTKGQAIKLGRVEADYAEVDVKNCGLRGEGNNS